MNSIKLLLSIFFVSTLISCTEEKVGPMPTGNSKIFVLGSGAGSSVSGTATFIENDDNSITIDLSLQNTSSGDSHPAHIHLNTAAEGGDIAITLGAVDGASGEGSITLSKLDNGQDITYADLLDIDGYINIHLSELDLGTIVAQGDIGQNELTGVSRSFALNSVSVPEISGNVTFEQRVNGEALATIQLQNTTDGASHPSHIHLNTAAEGGPVAVSFTPVDGTTGTSKTNISKLNSGEPFGYVDILEIDGYINVHLSSSSLGTLMAQGDIGQNELTGESISYELEEKDVIGINGTAEFFERVNGSTLVTLSLDGTEEGGIHPAHIHINSASEGGTIAISLNSVAGGSGISKTQVEAKDDESPISYTDLLTFDGHINVHLSGGELNVYIASGNIGENVGEETQVNYDVVNSGASAYLFTGNGLSGSSNPDLTLKRGMTYTFTLDAAGHPFFIKTVQGTGTSNNYDSGVTNNGAENGVVTFVVPNDAPNTLFYNCQFHESMTGIFTITD